MVSEDQAVQLKKAGLTAYNHNLDTSREHYPNVITTRSCTVARSSRTMPASLC